MKVILVGSSGFVGGAVLDEALAHPAITDVYAVSRRALETQHAKLHVLVQPDLSEYSHAVLEQLAGAEACIWSAGGKVNDFPSLEIARHVTVALPLALARALATHLVPRMPVEARPFRLICCSGWGAERDPARSLRIAAETRRCKGEMEVELINFIHTLRDDNNDGAAAAPIALSFVRPGGILPRGKSQTLIGRAAMKLLPAVVGVESLATCMVDVAVRREPSKQVYENAEIQAWPARAPHVGELQYGARMATSPTSDTPFSYSP